MFSTAFFQTILCITSTVISTSGQMDLPTLQPDITEVVTVLPPTPSEVTFNPTNLTKTRGDTIRHVIFETTLTGADHATYSLVNEMVTEITDFEFDSELPEEGSNVTGRGSFNASATFVGYNVITITIYDADNNTLGQGKIQMSVILAYQKMNQIFTFILGALVTLVYINMGATIDLEVVKQIAKKPIGPIVGIICQYGFMPVIAFGLAKLFFADDSLMQLGMFLNGAAPGGGSSNMWTLLLGGSLDLSIMMTFVSTIVAFAAVPIWVLSLGPQIIGADSEFQIPYGKIAMIVILLVIPCAIGVGLQKWSRKAADFLEKRVLKPFSAFNIIFIFTFGIYSYRYVFYLLDWKILLSCFGLPGLGYLAGLIMSVITRRNLADTIAISIETGVQNANIAIVILKVTLDPPSGDLAVVIPACCVLMTPIPLVFAIIVKKIIGRIRNSGGRDITERVDSTHKPKLEVISTISSKYISEVSPEENISKDVDNNNTINKNNKPPLTGVDNPAFDLQNDDAYNKP